MPLPKRRATCAGVARQRAGAPVHAGAVAWVAVCLECMVKRPERRRTRAALCAPHGSAVWYLSLALPVRATAIEFPSGMDVRMSFAASRAVALSYSRRGRLVYLSPLSARNDVAAHLHARQDLRSVLRPEGDEEHDLRDC